MTTTAAPAARSTRVPRTVRAALVVLALVAVGLALFSADRLWARPPVPTVNGWQFQDLDGPGVPGGNGRSSLPVTKEGSSTAIYTGIPHVFYRSGDVLRHAWAPTAGWQFETLDGPGAPGGNGRTSNTVGVGSSLVRFGDDLHVFYADTTAGVLRHGWYSIGVARWFFENLDGPGVAGGAGRTTNQVGGETTGVMWGGTPHVFYRDTSAQDLRHGWWTGTQWQFETLDGAGGANGRVTGDIAVGASAISPVASSVQVFYRDDTTQRLRQAAYDTASFQWQFADLDGPGVSGGRGRQDVSTGLLPSAVAYNGQPHVFYGNADYELRQAFKNSNGIWLFKTLQTTADCGGCKPGVEPAATLYNGLPAVAHHDAELQRLLLSRWTGSTWVNETLDGPNVVGGSGNTSDAVGLSASIIQYGVQLTIQNVDTTANRLRQAWFGPAPPVNQTLPEITGTPAIGETLSATTGLWNPTGTTYAYQWQRCPVVNIPACTDITDATSSTYAAVDADAGFALTVRVTATNAYGSAVATAAQTAVVTGAVPVNTVAPTVTGIAAVGETLTASTGTWTNAPTGYSYQWQRCPAPVGGLLPTNGVGCVDITAADSSSYTAVADDLGSVLRVVVVASNLAGDSAPAYSTDTAVVVEVVPEVVALQTASGPEVSNAGSVAAGPDGSMAVAGNFQGTTTFGTGQTSATTLTATGNDDVFVASYDADGVLRWARSADAADYAFARAVTVASDGSVIVTGEYLGPITFGAGQPNETTLPGVNTSYQMFVAAYDSSGVLEWARGTEGGTESRGVDVAVGADGNISVTGNFYYIVTFGAGQPNEATLDSGGNGKVFVASYDSAGFLRWVRSTAPNPSYSYGSGTGVAADGSIAVTGYFLGTETFGAGGPNETTLTSSGDFSTFVASYSSTGSLQWARQTQGASFDVALSGAVGPDGTIVTSGLYQGSVTFGAGQPNETTLSAAGFGSSFVASYDSAGTLRWARSVDGLPFVISYSVTVDAQGTVAIAGTNSGLATFDAGGPNETTLTATGGQQSAFVATYSSAGQFKWARTSGDSADGNDVAAVGLGVYATAGRFFPGPGTAKFCDDTDVQFAGCAGSVSWSLNVPTTTDRMFLSRISVVAQAPPLPANTTVPQITGTPKLGQTLSSSPGIWDGAPAAFTYQWQRCPVVLGALVPLNGAGCVDIAGATSSSYAAVADDVGYALRSVVTAANPAGPSDPAHSAETSVVTEPETTITSVAPNFGPPAGGTTVTITGTDFTGATAVTFGGIPATSYTVDSNTQITAVTPAGTGTVDVVVTTTFGTGTGTDAFTWAIDPELSVLQTPGGTAYDTGMSVAVAPDGSMLVTGYFTGTATFGAGQPNETTVTATGFNNSYVASYTGAGELRWVRTVSAGVFNQLNRGAGVSVGADGSVVVTGYFNGTATFGAGQPNDTTLTASPFFDVFVAKYDEAGVLAWARQAGGADFDTARSVSVAPDGSIGVHGYFKGSATFGAGQPNETTLTSQGETDVFTASYDTDGFLRWARQAGGTGPDDGRGTAAGSDGSVVVTGYFTRTATFGAGQPNQTTLTSSGDSEVYVATYDTDGVLQWAVSAGGDAYDEGHGVAIGADGTVAVAGSFRNTATFGAGQPSQTSVTALGVTDAFVATYDSTGLFRWVRNAGGGPTSANGVAVGVDGTIVMAGFFEIAATFGTGQANVTSLASSGQADMFVAPYSPTGELLWARRSGGNLAEVASGVAVGADGSYAVIGEFNGTTTFCDGAGSGFASCAGSLVSPTTATAQGISSDIALLRFGPLPLQPFNLIPPVVTGTVEAGGTLTSTTGTWTGAPTSFAYKWQRCDGAGANCVDIDGATASTYTVTLDDVGSTLRSSVVASNTAESAPAFSLPTEVVPSGPAVDVAQTARATSYSYGNATATGSDGRMLATGSFAGDATFGAGQTNEMTLRSNGQNFMYLASYAASGELQWATTVEGDGFSDGKGVTVAPDGTVVATGNFDGTMTFGAGQPNATTLTSTSLGSNSALFVAAYDANGELQWARGVGAALGSTYSAAASAGADGSVAVTGFFSGAAVFGAGETAETVLATPNTSAFLASYAPDGSLRWATASQSADPGGAYGTGATVGPAGDVTITGEFVDTVTFGAESPGAVTLTSPGTYSMYVARYSPSGVIDWAVQTQSNETSSGRAVGVTSDGNVAVGGYFVGSTTFGAGEANATTLNAGGNVAAFVAVYDRSGALQWARQAVGGYSYGYGLATTTDGGVAVVGGYYSDTTFGAFQPNETTLTDNGNGEAFVVVYDANGDLRWARRAGGPTNDFAQGAAAGPDGSVVVTGQMLSTMTFCDDAGNGFARCAGPLGSPTTLSAGAAYDGFLMRFATIPATPVVPVNSTAPGVSGATDVGETLSVTTGLWSDVPVSFAYRWQRCGGENCADIDNAVTNTYTVGDADIGFTLRAAVIASNAAGSSQPAFSTTTAVVTGPVPVNLIVPVVTGPPFVDEALSTTDGTWAYNPTSFAYKWQRCDAAGAECVDIVNATASQYAATPEDVGATLRATVTASNDTGPSEAALSVVTDVVRAGPAVDLAQTSSGSAFGAGRGVASGPNGVTVVAGTFGGTKTFGAGQTNETTLTASVPEGTYVASYAADGSLRWASTVGGGSNGAYGAAIASDGSVVVTGYFDGNATFGAGQTNETTLTGTGAFDIYLASYDTDGTLQWAHAAGGGGNDAGNEVAVGTDGRIKVTGYFTDAATFGADGPNPVTLNPQFGDHRMFLASYASDGALEWAVQASGVSNTFGNGVAVSPAGAVAVSGTFSSSTTFGSDGLVPNPTTLNATGTVDMFVALYEADGTLRWATSAGGPSYVTGNAVAVAGDGTVVVTGGFDIEATFDADGPTRTTLFATYSVDMFVATYAPYGAFQWARQSASGLQANGYGVAATATGNVVVTGEFSGTTTFGSGEPRETALTAVGDADVFAATYKPDGTLAWARQAGGSSFDAGYAAAVGTDGSVVVTGQYDQPATFCDDATPGFALCAGPLVSPTTRPSTANSEMFLMRFTSAPVTPVVPVSSTVPAVSGTAEAGQTLSVTSGLWSDVPAAFAYRWQRCDGENCADVDTAVTDTYLLSNADVGFTVRAVVVASNAAGASDPAYSTTTAVVTPQPIPPDNVTPPEVAGTSALGQTLTTSDGTWTNFATGYLYSWYRCDAAGLNCAVIDGAETQTYVLTVADVGSTLRAYVSATNQFGVSSPVATDPTAVVADTRPVNTAAPQLYGSLLVGTTESVGYGSWTTAVTAYAYQWQRCDAAGSNCVEIATATNSSYTVTAGDTGSRLRAAVTASNANGSSAPAYSAVSAVVGTPVVQASPSILGGAGPYYVGNTVYTTFGTWYNSPTRYDYKWQRCDSDGLNCADISNATSVSYVVVAGDAGSTLRSVVTASNSYGSSSPAASSVTAVVPAPPTVTSVSEQYVWEGDTVTITGTGFTNVSAVKFGTVPASSFTVNSTTQITATVPAPAPGQNYVYVTVTTQTGTGTSSNTVSYY